MSRLAGDELEEALASLPDWKYDGKAALNGIRRAFKFKDFKTAWAFMEAVAGLADAADHHPEWCNTYNKVEIMLTTHSAGGVTDKDIALAVLIDKILNRNSDVN